MTLVDLRPDGDPDAGPPAEERVSMQEAISIFCGMRSPAIWIEPACYHIELLKPRPEVVSGNP